MRTPYVRVGALWQLIPVEQVTAPPIPPGLVPRPPLRREVPPMHSLPARAPLPWPITLSSIRQPTTILEATSTCRNRIQCPSLRRSLCPAPPPPSGSSSGPERRPPVAFDLLRHANAASPGALRSDPCAGPSNLYVRAAADLRCAPARPTIAKFVPSWRRPQGTDRGLSSRFFARYRDFPPRTLRRSRAGDPTAPDLACVPQLGARGEGVPTGGKNPRSPLPRPSRAARRRP